MSILRAADPSTVRIVGWWTPVVLWMALILVASGDYFSFAQTGSWFSVLLGLVSDVSVDRLGWVHMIVRKTAHLVEYGVLGLLAYRAFQCTWRDWHADRWWMGSLALAIACATVDELYQSTIVSRTGSFWDVLVDASGAVLGILLFYRIHTNFGEAIEGESGALDSRVDA